MSDPFIGQITMVGFNFAPRNWAFCDGQLLPISQNQALFSLLGTYYGGDGRTTFALPDLRGRVPMHSGTGPGLSTRRLGEEGGEENVALSQNQLPAHSHPLNCKNVQGNQPIPGGHSIAGDGTGMTADYHDQPPETAMHASSIGNTGGNQAHANMQPYLCLNFVIALYGLYPSRNEAVEEEPSVERRRKLR